MGNEDNVEGIWVIPLVNRRDTGRSWVNGSKSKAIAWFGVWNLRRIWLSQSLKLEILKAHATHYFNRPDSFPFFVTNIYVGDPPLGFFSQWLQHYHCPQDTFRPSYGIFWLDCIYAASWSILINWSPTPQSLSPNSPVLLLACQHHLQSRTIEPQPVPLEPSPP